MKNQRVLTVLALINFGDSDLSFYPTGVAG